MKFYMLRNDEMNYVITWNSEETFGDSFFLFSHTYLSYRVLRLKWKKSESKETVQLHSIYISCEHWG